MAREHLEKREPWQGKGVARGRGAEEVFDALMRQHLKGTEIEAIPKPKNLKGIYGSVETKRRGKAKGIRTTSYGIEPEYAFQHTGTNKMIFVEIKRQRPSGNAHERACKYMMPGIVKSAQAIAKQPEHIIPFWWIFTNGVATDSRYRREIQHWFKGMEPHLLLWDKVSNHDQLIDHFDAHIRPLLD